MEAKGGTQKPGELTGKSAYLALLLALPVFILICILGKWEIGIGAWICAGLVLLIVRQRWDLRRRLWFWIVIATAFLLQVPLVLLIPWDDRNLTGISLLPVAVLDYGLVYGCIKLIENATAEKHEQREKD
jgi:hypothetical protein